ncbi:MAG: dynein regulation protein LC7, partial [Nanoarchaeota archaeon]|nr:dynein regulation protein LC7 [Nanoarchaeota archaeon]
MLDPLTKLALETIEKNKQAIIFVPSRVSAEKTAEEIAKLTSFNHPEFEQIVLKAASTPTKQCKRLANIIKKGIAFHHAGLLSKQKELIEEQFKAGQIKIIAATPTIAAGMSLPAFRVIIKSLKRYSGQWGMNWIPVLEYLQMAGRAGRPEYEDYGEAIIIAKNERDKEEIYNTYILGEPEEIYSKLAVEPVLRTYLLSLISSGIIRDQQTMQDFFSKTFWAYQFEDMDQLNEIMERMLNLLEQWEFVNIKNQTNDVNSNSSNNNDFIIASELTKTNNPDNGDNHKLRPTSLGKRISELYLDPLTARHLLDCLK